ncbi:GNAT family N-acetyltransferase [Azospira sp. I09]|jgi:hypothetical protein|uniref:GNAT family N-acetyltransferase n=1 Tax=Azospira sp. I09 TaxID=1765049 RepID=UPI001260864B|nr:GNAT family N-acetyltransferase [Azospira sp. I09]
MILKIRPFTSNDIEVWDKFCSEAIQATILHTRRYLSYHGDRFSDRSLILESNERLVGLFPAAESPHNCQTIISHPGITYGGLLHKGELHGENSREALQLVMQHYKSTNYINLIYKAIPPIYHRRPSQDDLYSLDTFGSRLIRRDLSCTIDLSNRGNPSHRRVRGLKNAERHGISILEGNRYLPDLWAILTKNLESRHSAYPTHSITEIELLANRFPNHIKCICGATEGVIVGGIVLYISPTCHHAQYITSSPEGNAVSVLDKIFSFAISNAKSQGARWFDFGISTEDNGRVLNNGLYQFKSEFGGGGTVHDFYELDLRCST